MGFGVGICASEGTCVLWARGKPTRSQVQKPSFLTALPPIRALQVGNTSCYALNCRKRSIICSSAHISCVAAH